MPDPFLSTEATRPKDTARPSWSKSSDVIFTVAQEPTAGPCIPGAG